MPKVKQKYVYLGVDPGVSGGLAVIAFDNIETEPIGGKTLNDLWDWFRWWEGRADVRCVIERVGGFIGTDSTEGAHRNKAAAHQMFNFGANFGALRAFLVAARIPYEEVLPQKWTGGLGIEPRNAKKEKRTAWKKRLATRARELYPDVKLTQVTADSLLIAEYCRRKWEGLLK